MPNFRLPRPISGKWFDSNEWFNKFVEKVEQGIDSASLTGSGGSDDETGELGVSFSTEDRQASYGFETDIMDVARNEFIQIPWTGYGDGFYNYQYRLPLTIQGTLNSDIEVTGFFPADPVVRDFTIPLADFLASEIYRYPLEIAQARGNQFYISPGRNRRFHYFFRVGANQIAVWTTIYPGDRPGGGQFAFTDRTRVLIDFSFMQDMGWNIHDMNDDIFMVRLYKGRDINFPNVTPGEILTWHAFSADRLRSLTPMAVGDAATNATKDNSFRIPIEGTTDDLVISHNGTDVLGAIIGWTNTKYPSPDFDFERITIQT